MPEGLLQANSFYSSFNISLYTLTQAIHRFCRETKTKHACHIMRDIGSKYNVFILQKSLFFAKKIRLAVAKSSFTTSIQLKALF